MQLKADNAVAAANSSPPVTQAMSESGRGGFEAIVQDIRALTF